MIVAKFECRMHEEYGTLGWAMVGKPAMEPLGGMAVPHDILEHFPNDDGSVEHEFMALGASLLVRDGTVYYSMKGNRHSAGVNLAAEFGMLYSFLRREGKELIFGDPGEHGTVRFRVREVEEIAADLDEMFIEASRNLLDELPSEDFRFFFSPLQQRKARGWFIKGYRRAQRRYKDIAPSHLCYVFSEIEQEANKLLKLAEEGCIMRVSVDVKRGGVHARILDTEDYYE